MLTRLLAALCAVSLMAGVAMGGDANFGAAAHGQAGGDINATITTAGTNNKASADDATEWGGSGTVVVTGTKSIIAGNGETATYIVNSGKTLSIKGTLTVSSTTSGTGSLATLNSNAGGVIKVVNGGTLELKETYSTGGSVLSPVSNDGYLIFEGGSTLATTLVDSSPARIFNAGKVAIDGTMTGDSAARTFGLLSGAGDVQLMGSPFGEAMTNNVITGTVYTGSATTFQGAFTSTSAAEIVIGGYSPVDPDDPSQGLDKAFLLEAGIISTLTDTPEAPAEVDFSGNFTAKKASIAEDVLSVKFAKDFALPDDDSAPFIVGPDQTVTYGDGGDVSQITADIVVQGKGSFATAGTGAILQTVNSSISVDAGGNINIGFNKDGGTDAASASTLNLGTGTLNVVTDSFIMAERGVKFGATLVDGNADFSTYTVDGTNPTGTDPIDTWLADSTYYAIRQDGVFVYDGGDIFFAGGDVDEEDWLQNFKDTVLPYYNVGDAAGLATQDTIDAFTTIADMEPKDIAALNDPNLVALQQATKALSNGDYHIYDFRGRSREAYNLIQHDTGADWANTIEAVQDTVRSFNNAISQRTYRAAKAGGCTIDECGNLVPTCPTHYGSRIWAGYTGYFGDADRRGTDRGYKYSAHGFNVGYDYTFNSGLSIGAAFGLTRGDYKNKSELSGHKNDIDNYSFGLYANWTTRAGFFVSVLGSYTYSEYEMYGRYVNNGLYDRGKYHGGTWSTGGKIGWDIAASDRFTITPTIGVFHYDTHTNRFNTATRHGMKYSKSFTEMPVELEMRYNIPIACEDGNLALVANGGYAYNFNNKGVKIHNFDMLGADMGGRRARKPGRSSWYAGAGVSFQYKRFDVGVNYEFYKRSNYDAHNINANIGLSF